MAGRRGERLDDREPAPLVAAIIGSTPGRGPALKQKIVWHRRTWAIVVGVTIALVIGVVYGTRSSENGSSHPSRRGAPTTAAQPGSSGVTFLATAKPRSVTFDSIAPLGDVLVASGRVVGPCFGSDTAGCRSDESSGFDDQFVQPVVWTSSDDGYRWTEVWSPGRSLIRDTASYSQLVQGPDGSLLLFDSGTPGTVLLEATNPSTWTMRSLPPAMAGEGLRNVTDTGTAVVASMVNRSGGLTDFSSTNGVTWEESGSTLDVPLQLEANGLGVVSFGASEDQVESILEPSLSAPSATPLSGCDLTHGPRQFIEIEWNDLVVEFNEGSFVGYRDILGGWSSIGSFGTPSGPSRPAITTATGIGLGSTLAQLKEAYPGLVQTGSFTWTSPDGIHFVLESGPPVSAQSTVMEIKTGTCGDF